MKKFFLPILILLFAWSCSSTQKAGSAESRPTIKSDSTEYEITIIDNEFDNWYLMNFAPSKDRSNEYYRSKNQVGVSSWNDYYTRNRYHSIIYDFIYFDNSLDYGIEVNRKLYWYFKYTEEKNNIRLFY